MTNGSQSRASCSRTLTRDDSWRPNAGVNRPPENPVDTWTLKYRYRDANPPEEG
jgi:hypothetical protein